MKHIASIMIGVMLFGSAAVGAPALKPTPSLAVARKALLAAGAPATDAEVQAAYPGFMLHPDHSSTPWFVASTDDGCLYYAEEPQWKNDPPAKLHQAVADWVHDHYHVKWTGTPCVAGTPISGQGTLSWGDANIRNTGHRDDDFDSLTGIMQNGVFVGTVQRDYSYDEARTRTIAKGTFEMFGGCSNLDPKMVNPDLSMCQPRVR